MFRRIAAPTERELQALVEQIAERIGPALERDGLITRDCENTYLNIDPAEGVPLNDLVASIPTPTAPQGTLLELFQNVELWRCAPLSFAPWSLHFGKIFATKPITNVRFLSTFHDKQTARLQDKFRVTNIAIS